MNLGHPNGANVFTVACCPIASAPQAYQITTIISNYDSIHCYLIITKHGSIDFNIVNTNCPIITIIIIIIMIIIVIRIRVTSENAAKAFSADASINCMRWRRGSA